MLGKPPVLLLMGPTASGKTALSVALAQRLNAEIISVDSAMVYRGMDIGTAKPDLAEQAGVVHLLIDILDPAESFSTGQFRDLALKLITEIQARGKFPILVGGTMLYFSALTQGLAQLPAADPVIRARLDQALQVLGKQAMHDRLSAIDPQSAARIHVNDPQRVQRALEVFELTGQTLTSFFSQNDAVQTDFNFVKCIINPESRQVLHEKIAQRFRAMLAQGLIAEVEGLYARGDLHPGLPSIRCVGYRQVWDYLQGEISRTELEAQGIAATRQLAKRQLTWLRKEQNYCALQTDDPQLIKQVLSYCQRQGVAV